MASAEGTRQTRRGGRAYRQAIGIKPDLAEAHSNLGVALREQGKVDEAVAACRQAIDIKPDYAEAHSNLGCSAEGTRQARRGGRRISPGDQSSNRTLPRPISTSAVALGNRASSTRRSPHTAKQSSIKPDFAEAHSNLGIALQEQGKLDEGVAAYRQAISIKPDFAEAFSNLLFGLNYDDKLTADHLLAAHREWDERYGRQAPRPTAYANVREAGRQLKIGYLSPDFRQHSVAYFVEPLLKAHDRQAVEVFCYAEVMRPDTVTALSAGPCRSLVGDRRTVGRSAGQAHRTDGIDILVISRVIRQTTGSGSLRTSRHRYR